MNTTDPEFGIRPAYACNDLARARKAQQDIIGYDVYHIATGVTHECFDTEEEAEEGLERLTSEGKL